MSNFKWFQKSRLCLFGFGTLGALAGVIAVNVLTEPAVPDFTTDIEVATDTESPTAASAPEKKPTISPVAIKMANDQLNWANAEAHDRLPKQFEPVEALFLGTRTREFAETCLSWRSKWLLLKDNLFDSAEHVELIETAFRSFIFDETELERLLEQCTTAYIQELKSIDNAFLVRLSVDWQGLPTDSIAGFDATTLRARYHDAVHRAVAASTSDVLATVEREVASFIVSEVMSAALVELGVSMGILGTGASSGAVTFGLGLLVGLIVDYAIQEYTDPIGELTAELDIRLRELRDAVIIGSEEAPGLLRRLIDVAGARALARRDAMQQIVNDIRAGQVPGGASS